MNDAAAFMKKYNGTRNAPSRNLDAIARAVKAQGFDRFWYDEKSGMWWTPKEAAAGFAAEGSHLVMVDRQMLK